MKKNVFKIACIMFAIVCTLAGCSNTNKSSTIKNFQVEDAKSEATKDADNQSSSYVIFDAKKLLKATKQDVDSLLGIVGIQDENEPYVYNYGEDSAIFDDSGHCINFFLEVEDDNYKISDEENTLKKYGLDLQGSKLTKNPTSRHYSNIKDFQEIDVWVNNSSIESISFFPEGYKKVDDFLIKKSNEFNSQKSSSNKNKPEDDFVINKDPIVCNANGECSLQKSVKQMTNDELRIARNEIYARHGYRFKEGRYKRYFEKQSWYNPTNDDSVEVDKTLSKNEKECVNLILDEEQKRGLTENFD